MDDWTGPSKYPQHWRRAGRFSAGLVLQFVSRADKAEALAATSARSLIAGLGLEDREIFLATVESGGFVRMKGARLDPKSVRTAIGDRTLTMITASYAADFVIHVDLLAGQSASVTVSATVRTDSESDREMGERMAGLADEMALHGELVSGGADVHWTFDPQRDMLWPRARSGGYWPAYAEEGLSCGYYWHTLVGARLLERLGEPPAGLSTVRLADGTTVALQAGGDPTDDQAIRSALPAFRSWLRPALPGWILAAGGDAPLRLLEGSPVPRDIALLAMCWLADRERIENNLRRLGDEMLDPLLRGSLLRDSTWSFKITGPAHQEVVEEAITASLRMVQRSTEDERLPGERLSWSLDASGSITVQVSASVDPGSPDVQQFLVIAMIGVRHSFKLPSLDGPIRPISALQVT